MSDIPVHSPLRGGSHAYPESDDEDTGFPLSDVDAVGAVDAVDAVDASDAGTVDLSADPFEDDLIAELAAAAPKRWTNRATYVIGALALLVGGFLAGVQVEKHYGTPASAAGAAGARRAGGLAGGLGGFGRGEGGNGTGGVAGTGGGGVPGGAGGSSATPAASTQTGTVRLVDGTTIYIGLANGNVLTVRTNASTKVSVGSVTTVSALKTGTKVTITGTTDAATGDVMATSVTAAQ